MKEGSGPSFAGAVGKRVLTPSFVAFGAGAAAVAGFAPLQWWPLAPLALALLVHLWLRARSARAAFLAGWCFGLGFFVAGVSWVYVSMHRFGGMPAVLAGLASLLFCAFLALFPALVGALQARIGGSPAQRALLVIPALWTLAEWARSWVLTGFPWLMLGYAASDAPLAGLVPVAGVLGASFVLALCAGLLRCIACSPRRARAALALAAILAAGAALRDIHWSEPTGEPFGASLLQGNVAQELKFDPARFAHTLETYARLAQSSPARLIVLPETALPRFLDSIDPAYLGRLGAIAARNDGDLLLGVPLRRAPRAYFNSMLSLGRSPTQVYDKVHLVPFGEFIPPGFGWVNHVLAFPLSDFTRGALEQPLLAVAGERVAVSICYEDLFGDQIRRQLPAATLLVSASNVAWFGDSLAPAQHLQIARLRSLETGRMLLAATNSGITAVIDRDGSILARLPQFVEARLDAAVRGYRGATPYVRFGDAPVLAVCALLLAAALAFARWRSRR